MDDGQGKPIDILLVEDNPGDVRLAREALRESKVRNKLYVVADGVEAMEFLRQQNGQSSRPRPDLVLLDLNLPRKSGREVLAEMKADEKLKRIPVVVMTVSKADEDVSKCYGDHANCYILKPLDFNRFIRVIQSIEDFWLNIVKLPPK